MFKISLHIYLRGNLVDLWLSGFYFIFLQFVTCSMGVIAVPSTVPITENESFERSYISLTTCCSIQRWNHRPITKFGIKPTAVLGKSYQTRRRDWSIAFALDTGEGPDSSGQESIEEDTSGLGSTRLGRIVRAGSKQLLEKLNAARKNLPMKVFLLLLGFYTANALATILGQTGDWDVLVAGVVVAAIEGIGVLMYRKPFSLSVGKFHSLVVMVNYWKAGVCLGLFVDAFKLGS